MLDPRLCLNLVLKNFLLEAVEVDIKLLPRSVVLDILDTTRGGRMVSSSAELLISFTLDVDEAGGLAETSFLRSFCFLSSLLYLSSYDGAFTLEEGTGFTDSLVDDSDTSNSRSKDLLERSFFFGILK